MNKRFLYFNIDLQVSFNEGEIDGYILYACVTYGIHTCNMRYHHHLTSVVHVLGGLAITNRVGNCNKL